MALNQGRSSWQSAWMILRRTVLGAVIILLPLGCLMPQYGIARRRGSFSMYFVKDTDGVEVFGIVSRDSARELWEMNPKPDSTLYGAHGQTWWRTTKVFVPVRREFNHTLFFMRIDGAPRSQSPITQEDSDAVYAAFAGAAISRGVPRERASLYLRGPGKESQILWDGVALSGLIIGGGLVGFFLVGRSIELTGAAAVRRWKGNHDESSCPHCGYDLRGLPTNICPECGRAGGETPSRSTP